ARDDPASIAPRNQARPPYRAACTRRRTREILQRAQFRMYRIVAAFGAADRVGATGITFDSRDRIIAPLAIGFPDRVDRREIDDVKTHLRDVGQARDAILEGAVLPGGKALAPGYHFVPCAEARPRPIRDKWKQL